MWLLDTNIASELLRRAPDQAVQARYDGASVTELAISTVTLFELRVGAARAEHPAKLWERIEKRILARCQIMPLRREEALSAADHLAVLLNRGLSITVQDILIAGTASARGLTLVTRNTRHFERILGLRLENWFEPPVPPA